MMIGKTIRFLAPKLFVMVSLGLALLIGNATFKEVDRGKRIQEEIASLRAESQKTQKENALLRERIRYFQTDAFQEQEARNKLNYQSPDEKVVVVKMGNQEVVPAPQDDVQTPVLADNFVPNYQKWWDQFFTREQGNSIKNTN